jgi:hypothetical protein
MEKRSFCDFVIFLLYCPGRKCQGGARENPGGCNTTGASAKGFGKKRGRKEDLRSREITAHGFRNLSVIRIPVRFERSLTET